MGERVVLDGAGGRQVGLREGTMWKRDGAGRQVNTENGIAAERSDRGGWNVINPDTGGVLDNLPTLRDVKRYYTNAEFVRSDKGD